jgi:hypothetical protein
MSASETSGDGQQVEVKVIGASRCFDVALIFENFPVWLLGLEPSRIQHIHIWGLATQIDLIDSLSSQGYPIKVLGRLLGSFGIQ